MAEGRLAYAIGDQLAQDKLMCKVGRGCSVCWAPAKKLDYTNKIWPLRDSAALLRSMQHLANDCLNDAGEVKHGKSQAIKEWEKENRMRFGSNGFLELLDLGFHATLLMPRDFLHHIILGLFGKHMVKAIIHLIASVLAMAGESAIRGVMRRLARRLSSLQADESCLTLSDDFAEHFLKVYLQGKSSFTGQRMTYIILVLAYVLRDIAGPERKRINNDIASSSRDDPLHNHPLIDDPCIKIVETLLLFLRWFLLIRRPELTLDQIVEGIDRGRTMMDRLKTTFPEKSGEKMCWNFPKFHDVIHIPLWIMLLGWIENFCGQSGERAHGELLKSLAGCINNQDVFMQYLRFWERAEQLSRAERQARASGDADFIPTHDCKRDEAMHGCELGVRCPLFFMALHRSVLHHRACAVSCKEGGKDDGRQRLNVWQLRSATSKAAQDHSILRRLPTDLAAFAYIFAPKSLGLPVPADRSGKPSVAELNNVLLHHLCSDRRGRNIRTFAIAELESEKCMGVQRVRCYPFSFDKFRRSNPRQYVGLVPPARDSGIPFRDFNLANPDHRRKMWVGRVELFFKASFRNAQGEAFEFDLAFLSCLYDFEHPSAMGPLQLKAGARMFYVPSIPWTIVLPINHILGRVPLMRLHLQGSEAPTIPHSFARDKEAYFEYGCADQAGRDKVGSGSLLFELNVHLWQFGRPQPRTMSVAERLQRQEATRVAARASTKRARSRGQQREATKRARPASEALAVPAP